jgi:flagellar capping protein FliD
MPNAMSTEIDIAIVQKDIEQMKAVFQKLDTAIEKMGDVSNSIGRMLAVHEERLGTHDRVDKELFEVLENTKEEIKETADNIQTRIQTSETRIMKTMLDMETRMKTQFETMDKRIAVLENWRLVLVGGAVVVGFLLNGLIEFLAK